jgi:pimeloyl-ACP methyl ester carboxylesterase
MNPEITGRYAEIQGHRLYMDVGGEPSGQPMLLIHTAGQQSLQWRFVIPYFAARGFYALAPDLPGHGKSLLDQFKPLESVHAFAEIFWDLLRSLRLDHPVVVGCSIGGDIALDLAVHHGSEIPAVVACQSAAFTPTFPPQAIELGLEDSGVPSYSDQGYLSGLSACGTKAEKERVTEIVWTRRLGDPKIYYSDLKAWIHHDLRPHLSKVSCPVLCVWGNEDYFVPRPLVEETVAGIPNSRLEVLDGIGHYPHIETREFNPLVERFLESLGIGKGKWAKK